MHFSYANFLKTLSKLKKNTKYDLDHMYNRFLFKHTTNSVFETFIKLNLCLILVTRINLR